MGAVVYVLLGWWLAVAACYAMGSLLVPVRPFTRQEIVPIRFVCGAALYSLLTFVLGLLHLYYRAAFVGLAIAAVAVAWRKGVFRLPQAALDPVPVWHKRIAWIVGTPFALLYLSNAMAPEASPDGAAYHLGLVARYYREHAILPVHTNMYAALSQGMEMLFLGAYAVGRHSAAALMHFTCLLALPWLLWSHARRVGHGEAGLGAAILVFASPVIGIDGISAYNDVAAAFLLFSLYVVLRRLEDHVELAALAGWLAGFGFAIKYTLFPASILTGVWILWRWRHWRPVLLAAGAAALSVFPWLLKNLIWWHNPLAPFFNHWFPNPHILYSFEATYRQQFATYGLPSLRQIPLEVTIHGANLNGLLGPVFLLVPLGLLALRLPEGRRLWFAAAFALIAYPSNIGTRFLIPVSPFAAFALALALQPVRWLPLAVAVIHAVASLPAVVPLYSSEHAWRLNKWPWRQALRIIPEEEFLASRIDSYPMARTLESAIPAGRRVLGFNQLPEAYTNVDYMVSFQSAPSQQMREIFLAGVARDRQPTVRVRLRVDPVRATAVRAVLNRTDPDGQWSVTELRIRHAETELPRSPHWRLRASSNLHQIADAFDGSLVTRWISELGRKAATHIEIDFGSIETIDTVDLIQPDGQPWDTYRLDIRTPEGVWTQLPTRLEPEPLVPPAGMRRAAIEELLRRNVQYLVIGPSDFGYEDVDMNSKVWGVEKLAERGTWRLYRLLPRIEFERLLKQ